MHTQQHLWTLPHLEGKAIAPWIPTCWPEGAVHCQHSSLTMIQFATHRQADEGFQIKASRSTSTENNKEPWGTQTKRLEDLLKWLVRSFLLDFCECVLYQCGLPEALDLITDLATCQEPLSSGDWMIVINCWYFDWPRDLWRAGGLFLHHSQLRNVGIQLSVKLQLEGRSGPKLHMKFTIICYWMQTFLSAWERGLIWIGGLAWHGEE